MRNECVCLLSITGKRSDQKKIRDRREQSSNSNWITVDCDRAVRCVVGDLARVSKCVCACDAAVERTEFLCGTALYIPRIALPSWSGRTRGVGIHDFRCWRACVRSFVLMLMIWGTYVLNCLANCDVCGNGNTFVIIHISWTESMEIRIVGFYDFVIFELLISIRIIVNAQIWWLS